MIQLKTIKVDMPFNKPTKPKYKAKQTKFLKPGLCNQKEFRYNFLLSSQSNFSPIWMRVI